MALGNVVEAGDPAALHDAVARAAVPSTRSLSPGARSVTPFGPTPRSRASSGWCRSSATSDDTATIASVRSPVEDCNLRSLRVHLMVGASRSVPGCRHFGPGRAWPGRPVLGLLVALLSVGAVCQDLLDFGSSQWLTRELAAGRVGHVRAFQLLRRRGALALVVCASLAVLAVRFGLSAIVTLAVAIYVVCAVLNAGAYARMRGAGLFRRTAVHSVSERFAWLVLLQQLSSPLDRQPRWRQPLC